MGIFFFFKKKQRRPELWQIGATHVSGLRLPRCREVYTLIIFYDQSVLFTGNTLNGAR